MINGISKFLEICNIAIFKNPDHRNKIDIILFIYNDSTVCCRQKMAFFTNVQVNIPLLPSESDPELHTLTDETSNASSVDTGPLRLAAGSEGETF